MHIEALIFDAEGVVIDTQQIWDQAQKEFFKRHGKVYDRARIKHLIAGMSLIDGVKVMQRVFGIEGDPEELAKERLEIVLPMMKSLKFVPGFLVFYEKQKSRYKTAIGTAMYPEILEEVDAKLQLRKLFVNNVYCISDVSYKGKPDPAIFLYAAKQLGVEPSRCVVFEDAPNGIMAAKRAGMYCIAITTTYGKEKLGEADQVVARYDEIELPTSSSAWKGS